MKVLVACEVTQTVTKAFRERGHEAYSCDLLPTEGNPAWHIQDDILKHLDDGWDLMIAHPPCTYLSNAGARFLYPKGILNHKRLNLGLNATDLFMRLYNANIGKICIENPIPSRVFGLPLYSQIIQPYYFGHNVQKKTCLWLKTLLPLTPTIICNSPQSTKVAGNWFNKGSKDRQVNRSRTFPGIAEAMAEQWG